MSDPIAQVVTRISPIDVSPERPIIGDKLEFIEKTGRAYDKLVAASAQITALADEINNVARTVNERTVSGGIPIAVDVGGAARGSATYIAAIANTPVEVVDAVLGRRLLAHNIAPDGDAPLSDLYIAELAPGGARWVGPLVSVLAQVIDTVEPPPAQNNAPVASAGADRTVTVGTSVTFSGSGSADSDGTIAGYEWREGSTVISTDATFSITPTSSGIRTFSLVVTDDDGLRSAPDTVRLTANAIAVPRITSPVAGASLESRRPTLVASDGGDNTRRVDWMIYDRAPSTTSFDTGTIYDLNGATNTSKTHTVPIDLPNDGRDLWIRMLFSRSGGVFFDESGGETANTIIAEGRFQDIKVSALSSAGTLSVTRQPFTSEITRTSIRISWEVAAGATGQVTIERVSDGVISLSNRENTTTYTGHSQLLSANNGGIAPGRTYRLTAKGQAQDGRTYTTSTITVSTPS